MFSVGMTRFELATTRPPDAYSTGLSYIPLFSVFECAKITIFFCCAKLADCFFIYERDFIKNGFNCIAIKAVFLIYFSALFF